MISQYFHQTAIPTHNRLTHPISNKSNNQNQRELKNNSQQPFRSDYIVPQVRSVDEIANIHAPFCGPRISIQPKFLILGGDQNESSFQSGIMKNIQENIEQNSEIQMKQDNRFEKFRSFFDFQKNDSRQIWILSCSDLFLKIWLTSTYILFFCINIYIPFQIAYETIQINSLFISLKLIDIFIFMRTEFYQNGSVVQKQQKIQLYYARTFLFKDLIYICAQFTLQISNQFYLNWIAIVFAIYASFSKSQYNFDWIKMQFQLNDRMSQLFHQTLILIVWINFLICFWLHQTSSFEDDIFQEKSYLSSLYHVVTIISFNSQFKPTTELDAYIFCGMSFISLLVVGYMGKIQWEAYCKDYTYEEESQNYLNQLCSTLSTKHLVKNYQSCREKINCENLMKSLPKDINTEISRQILKSYFKKYESLDRIAKITEIKQYEPHTMIITQSQQDDCSIYFLLQGKCKILTKTNTEILDIQENQGNEMKSFGELSFYTQQERTASIYCEGVCLVLKIKRNEFVQQLSQKDREYFNMIRDQILFQKLLPIACLCCQMSDHIIQKCPQLSYQPNPQQVIVTMKKTCNNPRIQYVRSRNKRSINGLVFARFAEINGSKFLKLFKSSSNQLILHDEDSFNQFLVQQDSFQPMFEFDEGNGSSFYQVDQEQEQQCQKSPKQQQISNHNITAGFAKSQFQNILQQFEQFESEKYDESEESIKQYQKSSRAIQNLNSYKSKGNDSLTLSPIVLTHNKEVLRRKSKKSSQNKSITKTGTKQSDVVSSFQAFQPQSNVNIYNKFEIFDDFDKLNNWSIFLPNNNLELVIQQVNIYNSKKQLTNKHIPGSQCVGQMESYQ